MSIVKVYKQQSFYNIIETNDQGYAQILRQEINIMTKYTEEMISVEQFVYRQKWQNKEFDGLMKKCPINKMIYTMVN